MQTQVAQPQYVITEQDKKRQRAIADAWQAFDDELPPSLEPMEGEDPELANVAENIVSSCVEDVISFLFGDELQITVDKRAPKEAQAALDETWGRKEARLPLLQELAQNGLLSGHGFIRIVPNADESIRLLASDPMCIFVQTAPGDCKTPILHCIEYCCEEMLGGKAVQRYYREEIRRIDPQQDDDQYEDVGPNGIENDVTWVSQHWTRIGDKGAWTPNGDPIVWPYSYCPLQGCQNLVRANSFWGKPDTTKGLIALNKAINFVLSNINKVGKLYAQPILYAPGAGEGVLGLEPGKIIQLPLPEQKIEAVQITSDLANHLLFYDKLEGVVERATSVPAMASGVSKNMPHQISGIALKTMCMALLKLIDKKRCLYGELIINVSKAILQIKGFAPEIDVTLGWQNPLPSDTAADANTALTLQQLGVSRRTLLRELGYDPEQEAELKKQEDEAAMVAFSRGQGFPPPNPMMQQQPPTDQPPQEQGQQGVVA
jgi:Phage portal protein, SPP1 Gp6-like